MSEQLIIQLFSICSMLGVFFFSVSGALFAAEKNMDILGFILVAAVTGVGGGTLRDLLLGVTPVFWIAEPINIYLCVIAASVTYFAVNLFRQRDAWILWMDAVGLSVFAILGAQAALAYGVPPFIAVVMGVMTATFGGIMRDVLCAEVLTLMRPEIYITCALLGAFVYVLLHQFGMSESMALIIAFVAGFSLRAAAIRFKLTLPSFKSFD